MKYPEFINLVQRRARLDNEEEALRATEATLKTLAERITAEEAEQLAAQLPAEVGRYLKDPEKQEAFDLDNFYYHVSIRESVGLPEVIRHARAVMSVVSQAVSTGEMQDILDQLPGEYLPLFTFGGDGEYRDL